MTTSNNTASNEGLATRAAVLMAMMIAAAACTGAAKDVANQTAKAIAPPPGLHEESVVFDPHRNTYVLFGGIFADSTSPTGYAYLAGTYLWNGERWLAGVVGPDAPSVRAVAAMTYDPVARRVILASGIRPARDGEESVRPCPSCRAMTILNDVWTYDGRSWMRSDDAPLTVYPAIVFDTQRRQLLLLGNHASRLGVDEHFPVLLWHKQKGRWTLIDSSGPRIDSPIRASFDERRGVLVLPILSGPDLGVWEWDGSWKRVSSISGPAARERFVITYDRDRAQVVLFGGRTADEQTYFNDLWSWNGVNWVSIRADSVLPSMRSDGSLHHDAATSRIVLIGGLGKGDVLHRDVWAFRSGRWSRIQ
jgi:hypothetical protein